MLNNTPENKNITAIVASSLNQNGSIKNVFGEPITAQGKTIIPVAQVAMGLGGGFGQGGKGDQNAQGEGAGAGGGLFAKPKGVYEITAKRTRFIPLNSSPTFLLGTALGLLVGWLVASRKG